MRRDIDSRPLGTGGGGGIADGCDAPTELGESFEGRVSKAWGLDPWQRGAFALHTPGQMPFIDTLARVEGRVHFAGEHTSAWTGWMQGALESTRRVAGEIGA